MGRMRTLAIIAVLILCFTSASYAANHYALSFWRNWSGQENGQSGPGATGNAFMRVFVHDEAGRPVKGVRVWFRGYYFGNWQILWQLTDDRGHVEQGFQFSGSPCSVWCSDNSDSYASTTDTTPEFYDWDNHRTYDIGFLKKTNPANPGTFNMSWVGDLMDFNTCPSTLSLTMNTPNPLSYYSGIRSLASTGTASFGQTFVASADRAVMMRGHLTKGFMTYWRYAAQIFEGGPDGPPVGPKLNLKHQYISDDLKYFLGYGVDECALVPGATYYVQFSAADGSSVNAYRCDADVYPNGTLYEDGLPVSGKDLQCYVVAMSSGNSNVGTVTGTVTDDHGQPIEEADIVLSPTGRRVVTGKLGTYRCANVPPGTYSLTASAPGFQPATLSGSVVSVGEVLTTNFTLEKDPGPLRILSTSGGTIQPGAQNVPAATMVSNAGGGDCFVNSAGLTFWNGAADASGYFSVSPSPANPTVIRGNQTVTFNFSVNSSPLTPPANYTVQGRVDARVNLQANGSFEADAQIPDYSGPTGWDWHSTDAPSVARLSYQHQITYTMPGGSMSRSTSRATIRWIGAWNYAGSKKQGFKLYVPKAGSATDIYKLRFDMRLDNNRMEVATGTPDVSGWSYYFVYGTYYQIDAWVRASDGRFQVDITPLQGQGSPGQCIGTGLLDDDTPRIEWGKTYATGTNEMWCREFHYWLEDTTPTELHWLAVNGYLPTNQYHPELGCGWSISGGSPGAPYEQIIPGVPWTESASFHITTADVKEGDGALQAWCSPSSTSAHVYISSGSNNSVPRMQVRPCTTYDISLWYKQVHYTANPANLRVIWEEYDSSGKAYFYEPDTNVGYRPPFHWDEKEPVSHGEWRYASYSVTTSPTAATGEVLLRMDKASSDAVADVFSFDDVKIMERNSYADTSADTPGTLQVGAPPGDISQAKQQPDGTIVSIANVPVTGYPIGSTSKFYIENADRSSGLLVDKSGGSDPYGVSENDIISLTGTMGTVEGERVLAGAIITSRSSGVAPEPLALSNRALGGASAGYALGVEAGVGTNNIGLLVTVFGRMNNAGTGYFYVDDGSGLSDGVGNGVKVICPGAVVPSDKTHAVVIGFSSVESVAGKNWRVVRCRRLAEISWH